MKNRIKCAANLHTKINTKLTPPPSPPTSIITHPNDDLFAACEGVYFSDYASASNLPLLQKHRITHIINCTSGTCLNMDFPGITYLNYCLQDQCESDLISYLQLLIPCIEEIRDQNGIVLIHCRAGSSRAPSIIAGYMIWKYRRSLEETIEHIKRSNYTIDINVGFMMQLEIWANK